MVENHPKTSWNHHHIPWILHQISFIPIKSSKIFEKLIKSDQTIKKIMNFHLKSPWNHHHGSSGSGSAPRPSQRAPKPREEPKKGGTEPTAWELTVEKKGIAHIRLKALPGEQTLLGLQHRCHRQGAGSLLPQFVGLPLPLKQLCVDHHLAAARWARHRSWPFAAGGSLLFFLQSLPDLLGCTNGQPSHRGVGV